MTTTLTSTAGPLPAVFSTRSHASHGTRPMSGITHSDTRFSMILVAKLVSILLLLLLGIELIVRLDFVLE